MRNARRADPDPFRAAIDLTRREPHRPAVRAWILVLVDRTSGLCTRQAAGHRCDVLHLEKFDRRQDHRPSAAPPAEKARRRTNRAGIRLGRARLVGQRFAGSIAIGPAHVAPVGFFPSTNKIPVKALVVRKRSLFNKLLRLRRLSYITICLILDNLPAYHFIYLFSSHKQEILLLSLI